MWLQGEGEMPLEVFNSATVYLKKKGEKKDEEGEGRGEEMPSLS